MGRTHFFIAILVLAVTAQAATVRAQTGFDRPGGDYGNFQIDTGDPEDCAARCERDPRCRAWTFAYPDAGPRSSAQCWLKERVTARSKDDCCVSGVRGAAAVEPREQATEYSIDRLGGDYRNFVLKPDASGDACRKACEGDSRCRAWTYLRPGYIGQAARCFLKGEIKRPRNKPCCISGVIR